MFVKVMTDCRFAGCNEEHLVEVPDGASERELTSMVDDFVQEDIAPEGCYEVLDDDGVAEMVDNGYEVETYGGIGVEEDDDNDVPGTGEDE